jgi:SAM-dependent methyltransferase
MAWRPEDAVTSHHHRFIPALSHRWLTPLYDPLMRWGLREAAFKGRLVRQARIEAGQRVLDLGCGTGTLALMVKRTQPEAQVVGLEVDPAALKLAWAKARKYGLEVGLDLGTALQLPYRDGAFHRVLVSLVLHHLTPQDRARALKEVLRVLAPGGQLHVVDFGPPAGPLAWLPSLLVRRAEHAREFIQGRLPQMLREAGFDRVEEGARCGTVLGTLAACTARKAG